MSTPFETLPETEFVSGTLLSTPEHFVTAIAAVADKVFIGCGCGDLVVAYHSESVVIWDDHCNGES